jgi:hypothetical protein
MKAKFPLGVGSLLCAVNDRNSNQDGSPGNSH